MISLSAILCTKRKEPMFQGMADSYALALNHVNVPVELIVVDGILWEANHRERLEQLAAAIRGRFPYRHVPPKPTPWQGPTRKTQSDYYGLCNARNTGIALARSSHVILFDDCSLLDDAFFMEHARAAVRGLCVAGSFRSYTQAQIENGKVVEGTLHPNGIDGRGTEIQLVSGSWMYGLNTSFPLEAALRVNGYDELFDGQGGSEDCEFGLRVGHAGYKVAFIPGCKIDQILTTHEPVCEFASWGAPQPRKQKERLLADGKMHFANEWLLQEWLRKPHVKAKGNDFDLAELRRTALSTGIFPVERTCTVDWRDNQPLAEMI